MRKNSSPGSFKGRRVKPCKQGKEFRQIWRIVDGALRDTLAKHPEYISEKKIAYQGFRISLIKRITGAIVGHAAQAARYRSGAPIDLQAPAVNKGE
jgi:hypothetical protein